MARIVAHAATARRPANSPLRPSAPSSKLFERTGWSRRDVDLFEINEAFAMVTMLAMRDHGLDHAKVNIHGGACAQGHPIGSTGSRIIVTLMHALRRTRRQARRRRPVHRRRRGHGHRHRAALSNKDVALSQRSDLIEAIRRGQMVILMDDEDRENEGDLIIAAEAVTPEIINFFASEACGLICMPITEERARQLQLPLMVRDNRSQHETNFTVSIDAAESKGPRASARYSAPTRCSRGRADAGPPTSASPGISFRWWPSPAACCAAPGTRRPGWISRAWPASSRRP
jgi:hypothetical protein